MSKLACILKCLKAGEYFVPRQLGISPSAGAESAIHVVRNVINHKVHEDGFTAGRVDYKNAFNQCERDTILEAVRRSLPEIARGLTFNANTLYLAYHGQLIDNSAGVQQGDPLGPILLTHCLRKLTGMIQKQGIYFRMWYMDDGLLIGRRSDEVKAIAKMKTEGPRSD